MHEAPEDHGSEDASSGPPDGEAAASFYDLFGTQTLLLLFTGCLLLYFLFQGVLWGGRPGVAVWGLALAPVVGILVPIALVIRSLRRPVRSELWLFPLDGWQGLGVVLAILGTVPLDYALSAANLWFVAPDAEALRFQQNLVPTDAVSLAGGLVAVVVLGPLGEEVLFRALLLGTMGRLLRPWVAAVVVGVLFGMTHLAPWALLPLSLLGIVLGFLVLMTRTLTAAWLGHALFNLIGYLELARTGDVDTPALTRLSLQPGVLIGAPLLLGMAFWLLRRGGRDQDDAEPA